ncbi:hypothetical protein [Streptomyces sp. NPDC058295]|uniref:hypothetical protein n=1 Tax=Streptomyces sp. NPDC058295 TaxID=3346431 RepID=UPI0036EEDF13
MAQSRPSPSQDFAKVLGKFALRHGSKAIIDQLVAPGTGALAIELFDNLAETENLIEQRLISIESRLSEIIEQRYTVAMRTGTRYLTDSGYANSTQRRIEDLHHARAAFTEASAAARTPVQGAAAERSLLLTAISLGWNESAARILNQMDTLSLNAALDSRLGRADGGKDARAAADDVYSFAANLMSESTLLAEAFGLPARRKPSEKYLTLKRTIPRSPRPRSLFNRLDNFLSSKPAGATEITYTAWAFDAALGDTINVGPLSVHFIPGRKQSTKSSATQFKPKREMGDTWISSAEIRLNLPAERTLLISFHEHPPNYESDEPSLVMHPGESHRTLKMRIPLSRKLRDPGRSKSARLCIEPVGAETDVAVFIPYAPGRFPGNY